VFTLLLPLRHSCDPSTLRQAHPSTSSPFDKLTLRQAHPSTSSPFDKLTLRQAHPSTSSGWHGGGSGWQPSVMV